LTLPLIIVILIASTFVIRLLNTNGRRIIIRNQISGFAKRLDALRQQSQPVKTTRRKLRFKIKPSLVAIYVGVFVFVVAIIFLGYQKPIKTVSSKLNTSNSINNMVSVDDVVATNVAAVVASSANLPIAPNISNLAISTQTQFQFNNQVNNSASVKPQIVGSVVANRSITTYTVKDGDTINSIAANFKISKDTIKWANDLVYDNLSAGKELRILPIDGTAYTVKSGDTVDSLAEKYKVDKTRLVVYNDLDVSGLVVGNEIILPSGILPDTEKPGYVAPVVQTFYYYAGVGTGFGGVTWNIGYGTGPCPPYVYGQCTCYAYSKRISLGLSAPAFIGGGTWGDARSWAENARQTPGFTVDSNPSVGSIMQNGGWPGHVAIVESLEANGDVKISEMNISAFGGGWNVVSGRIIPASSVGYYLYIH
jgi:LysM repeat protein